MIRWKVSRFVVVGTVVSVLIIFMSTGELAFCQRHRVAGTGQTNAGDQQSAGSKAATNKLDESTKHAASLFAQQKWSEARSAYDSILDRTKDWSVPEARQAVERSVACSLKLRDFNAALQRTTDFQANDHPPESQWNRDSLHSPEERKVWEALVAHFDLVHRLIEQVAHDTPTTGHEALRRKLAEVWISIDFDFLNMLDPDVVPESSIGGWSSRYPEMEWWWTEVTANKRGSDEDDSEPSWSREAGIPLSAEGRPIFQQPPARFTPRLGRSAMVLFLLSEVERLDPSPNRDHTARAWLHRADITRRLYGPGLDPSWKGADFEYRIRERPRFQSRRPLRGLKEFWQLADDEARTIVGGRLCVISLPPSESPLALWSRIEKQYPKSQAVAEAIYQRGLYFQNRQQFAKAIEEYRRLIARFPKHPRAEIAQRQLAVVEHADVLLGSTGVYPAGSKPKLWFACRNAEGVEFIARRFDLKRYIAGRLKAEDGWEIASLGSELFPASEFGSQRADEQSAIRAKFVGPEVARWSATALRSERVRTHTTFAPLLQPGTYVVEARVPGNPRPSSGLLVVTDAAVIQKSLPGKVLLWAVDARTGRLLVRRRVEIHTTDQDRGHRKRSYETTVLTTDERGVIEFVPQTAREGFALLMTEGDGIAFCTLRGLDNSGSERVEGHAFGVTDRPLYRPGSAVHFRLWAREMVDRRYRPVKAGVKLRVQMQGPFQRDQPKTLELITDEVGAVTGSVQLTSEASLGEYRLQVEGYGRWRGDAACSFSVEEYKKPEFEVTVKPLDSAPRLGEVFSVRVTGRYHFGGPVAGGRLHYWIRRSDHRAHYAAPREWDWLYGRGFGDYEYSYPWFGTADMQDEGTQEPEEPYHAGGMDETVAVGSTQLNADGWADIRIDTASAPRDCDQAYEIGVAVRDESRRTIEATETIIATLKQFHAFVEVDRGWCEPGGQTSVDISARTTNNTPIDVEGTLTLYRVPPGAALADTRAIAQEKVTAWRVRTGPQGRLRFPFRAAGEGQYRLTFEALDALRQPVKGTAGFWVYGPKFDGRQHRIGHLELIPDRRWYKVGDTARVLINTSHPDARLLLCDSFGRYWFLDVPAHSRMIELPILEQHVPNYFVEATLVADGRDFSEKCELFIPPVQDIVNLDLRPDRAAYKPGAKGRVEIKASDLTGKPISGPMTLTAYDKSLLYFQNEEPMGPRSLVVARKTDYWWSGGTSSLGSRLFSVSGTFVCPEFHLDDAAKPPTGAMGGSTGTPSDPSESKSAEKESKRRAVVEERPKSHKELVQPEVRRNLSDTAAWLPNLNLDEHGTASAEIVYPESLTTWRIRGYVITKETRVGEGAAETTTTKPFLVRLQSPRFAVEYDEVTLSTNVHNGLASQKDVTAELIVPAALFEPVAKTQRPVEPDKEGNLHFTAHASVAHSQHRFDWPLTARSEGVAAAIVKAASDEAGDAMRLEFPVRPRGTLEKISQAGTAVADDMAEKTWLFELPPEIDPAKTRVELSLAPSGCGSAFEAIPFLAGYPYGCVEQTMSRFYPTVLAVDTLRKLGVDLETLTKTAREHRRPFDSSPVLDSATLNQMTQAGLARLYQFQHSDGGWGWWENDRSSPYMTAYVLVGLDTAAGAGVTVSDHVFEQALDYLFHNLFVANKPPADSAGWQERALVCYALSLKRTRITKEKYPSVFFSEDFFHTFRDAFKGLYTERQRLNEYGRALLALSLLNRGEPGKAAAVLGEVLKSARVDQTHATAWIPTDASRWWHWYNGDIETNACVLRALTAIDPKNSLAPEIVNWLVAHRHHGGYWSSTRDTAQAVHALAEYMLVAKEKTADFSVSVGLDGRHVADVGVNWHSMLAGTSRVVLDGKGLTPGRHRITVAKSQRAPLYYSMTAHYFNRSESIKASGEGMHIARRYFRRVASGATAEPSSDTSTPADAPGRSPLHDGDAVNIGETLDVEFAISCDEDYEFVAIEDPKPAGFEPTQLRSGYGWGDAFCSNVELRDENVVFFAERLPKGKHVLRYKLRAEVPGSFQARPTHAFDMYHPEIRAQSAGFRLGVHD